MRGSRHWKIGLALALGALLPTQVLAAEMPSATIGNGVVSLGVSGDAAILGLGLGSNVVPAHSTADWELLIGPPGALAPTPLTDSFSTTGTGAVASALVTDSAGDSLRVTHDFHPAAGDANLYEVTVTITNAGTTAVQPRYERTLGWSGLPTPVAADGLPTAWPLQPTADGSGSAFSLSLPLLQPGATQTFRLYVGSLGDAQQAQGALTAAGAELVTAAPCRQPDAGLWLCTRRRAGDREWRRRRAVAAVAAVAAAVAAAPRAAPVSAPAGSGNVTPPSNPGSAPVTTPSGPPTTAPVTTPSGPRQLRRPSRRAVLRRPHRRNQTPRQRRTAICRNSCATWCRSTRHHRAMSRSATEQARRR